MPTTQTTKSKDTVKKGGSVMSDINKLVVPFGLVLAERGLRKLSKDDASKAKKEKKDKVSDGQKAAVGGAKKAAKGKKPSKKVGGAVNFNNEFDKLSSEIEKFLAKY